jgi:DNA mismatch endonuclease (patch repair protein)
LVFTRAKVAVFVDGCFWHGCPQHYYVSGTNGEYWSLKISKNRERDIDTDRRLREAGWEAVRIWEHEDVLAATERVVEAVTQRTRRVSDP